MRAQGVSDWGTLVFEIMSQQTPISRVQPIWLEWMERWPTPADLATASSADIIVAWANRLFAFWGVGVVLAWGRGLPDD